MVFKEVASPFPGPMPTNQTFSDICLTSSKQPKPQVPFLLIFLLRPLSEQIAVIQMFTTIRETEAYSLMGYCHSGRAIRMIAVASVNWPRSLPERSTPALCLTLPPCECSSLRTQPGCRPFMCNWHRSMAMRP